MLDWIWGEDCGNSGDAVWLLKRLRILEDVAGSVSQGSLGFKLSVFGETLFHLIDFSIRLHRTVSRSRLDLDDDRIMLQLVLWSSNNRSIDHWSDFPVI